MVVDEAVYDAVDDGDLTVVFMDELCMLRRRQVNVMRQKTSAE